MINSIKSFFCGSSRRKKILLFYIKFRKMQGGHLKAWHYFRHTLQSDEWTPRVYFDPSSMSVEKSFWWAEREHFVDAYEPERADAVFVTYSNAWDLLARCRRDHQKNCPVVALVQGLRHADSNHYLYNYLRQPAVRICVSEEVATAIHATGIVTGPVFTNQAATDLPVTGDHGGRESEARHSARRVFIAGTKNPAFAKQLEAMLQNEKALVTTILDPLPREEFLATMARSETAIFLPLSREGFYLPALEAMALGTLVICPDVGGNRSFCRPDDNCFRPDYNLEGILSAWQRSQCLAEPARTNMLAAATATAREHSLEQERRRYLTILGKLETLWRETNSS